MTRSLFSLAFIFIALNAQAGDQVPLARTITASNGGWSYYGLTGGPTVVAFPPCESYGRPLLSRIGDHRNPGFSFYIPPEPSFGPTAPRTLRLGWLSYSTPSPRGTNNVSVNP